MLDYETKVIPVFSLQLSMGFQRQISLKTTFKMRNLSQQE